MLNSISTIFYRKHSPSSKLRIHRIKKLYIYFTYSIHAHPPIFNLKPYNTKAALQPKQTHLVSRAYTSIAISKICLSPSYIPLWPSTNPSDPPASDISTTLPGSTQHGISLLPPPIPYPSLCFRYSPLRIVFDGSPLAQSLLFISAAARQKGKKGHRAADGRRRARVSKVNQFRGLFKARAVRAPPPLELFRAGNAPWNYDDTRINGRGRVGLSVGNTGAGRERGRGNSRCAFLMENGIEWLGIICEREGGGSISELWIGVACVLRGA